MLCICYTLTYKGCLSFKLNFNLETTSVSHSCTKLNYIIHLTKLSEETQEFSMRSSDSNTLTFTYSVNHVFLSLCQIKIQQVLQNPTHEHCNFPEIRIHFPKKCWESFKQKRTTSTQKKREVRKS